MGRWVGRKVRGAGLGAWSVGRVRCSVVWLASRARLLGPVQSVEEGWKEWERFSSLLLRGASRRAARTRIVISVASASREPTVNNNFLI